MHSVLNEKVYIDVHAWCFVPHSFRLIIHDLYCLGLIRLQEVEWFATEGCEFFITLSRQGTGIDNSRLEILETIENELSQTASGLEVSNDAMGTPKDMNFFRRLFG